MFTLLHNTEASVTLEIHVGERDERINYDLNDGDSALTFVFIVQNKFKTERRIETQLMQVVYAVALFVHF